MQPHPGQLTEIGNLLTNEGFETGVSNALAEALTCVSESPKVENSTKDTAKENQSPIDGQGEGALLHLVCHIFPVIGTRVKAEVGKDSVLTASFDTTEQKIDRLREQDTPHWEH